MKSLYSSEKSEADQFIEINSANNSSTQIKLKLLSSNTIWIHDHFQKSWSENVNDQKWKEFSINEYQSLFPTVFWDARKVIKELSIEEIQENILSSVCKNNKNSNQIILKKKSFSYKYWIKYL